MGTCLEITNHCDALARSHGYSSESWTYHNFYHSDGNGNVVALVNSGGTLQASYIYDPYGRYLIRTGTLLTSNVMRFSSKPWVSFLSSSTTSGLYYYGYRFYDPYLQRWLNRDLVGEQSDPNLYRFLGNEPLSLIDVLGLDIYKAACVHAKIIGDRPNGGCYSIEFTKRPERPYSLWNPGYYEFHEWSHLPPSEVANLRRCSRIVTSPIVDKILYTVAKGLDRNDRTPQYNFFTRNCHDFANEFCIMAHNLQQYGTWYVPTHSRVNRPTITLP